MNLRKRSSPIRRASRCRKLMPEGCPSGAQVTTRRTPSTPTFAVCAPRLVDPMVRPRREVGASRPRPCPAGPPRLQSRRGPSMRSRLMMSVSFSVLFWVARPAAAQFYTQHDFVADEAGVADHSDAHLVNAWGLVSSATSPWWVADNGTGTATLYDGHGVARALVVSIPGGAPTGIVFNGGAGFVVHTTTPPGAGPARFIFATENGVIAGWNPAVPPPPTSTHAQVAVDNSASGAVYKGLTIASTTTGDFLYATDFHHGRVDVFNSAFVAVHVPGAFGDSGLPAGYAPFGIQNISGTIYVTYALQDAVAHDDVPGVGHGFVDAYDTAGNLIRRVASRGRLNSPWGLALAPATFGFFAGDLLVC